MKDKDELKRIHDVLKQSTGINFKMPDHITEYIPSKRKGEAMKNKLFNVGTTVVLVTIFVQVVFNVSNNAITFLLYGTGLAIVLYSILVK